MNACEWILDDETKNAREKKCDKIKSKNSGKIRKEKKKQFVLGRLKKS